MRDMDQGTRVVAITGASSGVGRAAAREFARQGATLGLIARNERALAACAEEVRSLGGDPVVLVGDVAEPEAVRGAAERLEREHGPIEVWVNNAMATVFGPVRAISPEEYLRVTEVTYLGVVYGTLSALRVMRPRDRGVIVQVGSALAYRGIPLQSAYCAAKHAIQGFTESLRCELLHDSSGVRVTMVQLPAVTRRSSTSCARTSPSARVRSPPSTSRSSPRARSPPPRLTRTGASGGSEASTALTLIGNALAPGVGDRYLARNGCQAQLLERDDRAGPPRQPVRAGARGPRRPRRVL